MKRTKDKCPFYLQCVDFSSKIKIDKKSQCSIFGIDKIVWSEGNEEKNYIFKYSYRGTIPFWSKGNDWKCSSEL